MNYQHYNKVAYSEEFYKSKIYKKLHQQYQHFVSDTPDLAKTDFYSKAKTQRSHRYDLEEQGICVFSQFYYLDRLQETNPTTLADVGCGSNLIKKYIPNVTGFDITAEADYQELFNDEFVKNHASEFDSAFAVNSIHYVSLLEFANRINQFGKIIKSGGLGFVTFNLHVMITNTKIHEFAKIFDLSRPVTTVDHRNYIESQLKDIKYNILLIDIVFGDIDRYEDLKGADWPSYDDCISGIFTNTPEHVIEEIKNLKFGENDDGIYDPYNGNIRIIFKV
jgi:hypothetical protein